MAEFTVERSVEVEAPVEAVWDLMMDVKSWPEWKPFMTKASIAGGYDSLSNGSKIRMSVMAGGPAAAPLSATVIEFNRPHRLAWEGGVKGLVHAVHSFDFRDKGGKTLVVSRETFSGALLWLINLMVTREDLEVLHEKWVAAIKQKLEGKPQQAGPAGHGH